MPRTDHVEAAWLVEKLDPDDDKSLISAPLADLPRFIAESEDVAAKWRDFRDGELAKFLAAMQPGDELWSYESPGFRSLAGSAGYAIVRGGQPVCGCSVAKS